MHSKRVENKCETKTGRRNQMMLILYYDTVARIEELLEMNLDQMHLEGKVPYMRAYEEKSVNIDLL